MLFPLILSLKERGLIKRAIVPKEAINYLSHISGVEFITVETLDEAIRLFHESSFAANTQQFDYHSEKLMLGDLS